MSFWTKLCFSWTMYLFVLLCNNFSQNSKVFVLTLCWDKLHWISYSLLWRKLITRHESKTRDTFFLARARKAHPAQPSLLLKCLTQNEKLCSIIHWIHTRLHKEQQLWTIPAELQCLGWPQTTPQAAQRGWETFRTTFSLQSIVISTTSI